MRYSIKSIYCFQRGGVDYLPIGSSPSDERCIQVGEDRNLSILECEIYIEQLTRKNGLPPEGAVFFILRNVHEFGIYYEAAIQFDPQNESATEYAFQVENGDRHWDEPARQELARHDFSSCKRA